MHDGRLALLYGRARLQQGQVGEAEQAMRVAERLDPNDGDVAVLDAEVALAKGYEDKVVAGAGGAAADAAQPGGARSRAGADAEVSRGRGHARRRAGAPSRRRHGGHLSRDRARAPRRCGRRASRSWRRRRRTLNSTAPRYGIGLLAYERHDLLDARSSELGKALEHNSESFRARALLGRVLRDLGKAKEALDALDAGRCARRRR